MMNEKEATPKWAKWGVDFILAYDGRSVEEVVHGD